MNEETWTISAFVGLLLVSHVLVFKMGTWKERRDYTAGFAREVEAAYWDGYKDGLPIGQKQGYEKCMNDDFRIKDQY